MTKKTTNRLSLSRETVRELTGTELGAAAGGIGTTAFNSTKCPTVDVLQGCTSYFPSCLCAPTGLCFN